MRHYKLSCIICNLTGTYNTIGKLETINSYVIMQMCPLHLNIYNLLGQEKFIKRYSVKRLKRYERLFNTGRYERRTRYIKFI